MTFQRADLLRPVPSGVSVGGHLLEVHPASGTSAWWRLRCGGCLAQLADGEFGPAGSLLAGAQTVPAAGGLSSVSWAWGAAPIDPSAGPAPEPAEIVFVRGVLRQAAVAPAYPVGPGAWVAAAPGRARSVIAVSPGRAVQCLAEQLVVPACPGPVAGARR